MRKESIMASIDKVKVADTTYDVSPSKDGTLNGYTSGDNASPSAWGNVSAITTSDTNSSIFNKITTMVRNVRWLYNKLGTVDISATGSNTISGGLVGVQNGLNSKADNGHSHGVGDLPVSNSSVNSTSYVPSSAMVYSLKSVVDELNNDVIILEDNVLNPNKKYESKDLGTWSSFSQVVEFLNTYNHDNNYEGLSLGNYVTISAGDYTAQWVIAGFDCEHNRTAADGTVYDNGYGICLIPKSVVITGYWNYSKTVDGAYISSGANNIVLDSINANLIKVLGTCLVKRNVLLSNSVDSTLVSNNYEWTVEYSTLMSGYQVTGEPATYKNKYDDGEANYKLPLFDNERYYEFTDNRYGTLAYYLRGIYGDLCVYMVQQNTKVIGAQSPNQPYGIRPMIYIRQDYSANGRYSPKNLGTWSSVSDVDAFMSKYNHENNYSDPDTGTSIGLGDYVTIQDGTYNAVWEIAGFDMENNQKASDGTVYDNGYGICLIPKKYVTSGKWNSTNYTSSGYVYSYMHTTLLPNIVSSLQNVLGSHIVNRNVLLSSSVSVSTGYVDSTTWTTAYATLMSYVQVFSYIDSYTAKNGVGEATYMLPLFMHESYGDTTEFSWLRDPNGTRSASVITIDNELSYCSASDTRHVRPMIYIR